MGHEDKRHNEVTYMFEAEDIRELLKGEPDYFLIKTSIEPRTMHREYEGKDEYGNVHTKPVGVVVVTAEAHKNGTILMGVKTGCPVPPCTPR